VAANVTAAKAGHFLKLLCATCQTEEFGDTRRFIALIDLSAEGERAFDRIEHTSIGGDYIGIGGQVFITRGSPALFSFEGQDFAVGDVVSFDRTNLTNRMSPQVAPHAPYYVVESGVASGLAASQFRIASTPGGAPIAASGPQVQSHYVYKRLPALPSDRVMAAQIDRILSYAPASGDPEIIVETEWDRGTVRTLAAH
jgi:hypothetical protein